MAYKQNEQIQPWFTTFDKIIIVALLVCLSIVATYSFAKTLHAGEPNYNVQFDNIPQEESEYIVERVYYLNNCEYEDDFDCIWQANVQGDGLGTSFVDINGMKYVYFPKYDPMLSKLYETVQNLIVSGKITCDDLEDQPIKCGDVAD